MSLVYSKVCEATSSRLSLGQACPCWSLDVWRFGIQRLSSCSKRTHMSVQISKFKELRMYYLHSKTHELHNVSGGRIHGFEIVR